MTKRKIPPLKFNTAIESTDTAGTRDVPVSDLTVLDNLNLRVEGTIDYEAGITELAAKIEANGFYPDKPLAGYETADGSVIVTDGHRRLAAVRRLNDLSLDGDVIPTLPVVVKPGTLADVMVAMIATSEGKELTMLEKGIGVSRLLKSGVDKDEIARRLGVHVRTIDNYLTVASAPAKARDLLLDGKVTSTQVLRAKGDTSKLDRMVEKAKAAGRERARPSDAKPDVEGATDNGAAPLTAEQVAEGVSQYASTAEIDAAADAIVGRPSTADDGFTFSVDILKDQDLGPVLRQIAQEVRARVPHDQGDDTDAAHANGTIRVSIGLAPAEKPKRNRKKATVEILAKQPDSLTEGPVPEELAHALVGDKEL